MPRSHQPGLDVPTITRNEPARNSTSLWVRAGQEGRLAPLDDARFVTAKGLIQMETTRRRHSPRVVLWRKPTRESDEAEQSRWAQPWAVRLRRDPLSSRRVQKRHRAVPPLEH